VYAIGSKAIVKLCLEQSTLEWHRAKLSEKLFKQTELAQFLAVKEHIEKHHALPHIQTVVGLFPELQGLVDQVPEPVSYYVEKVDSRFFRDKISESILKSQEILQSNQNAWLEAQAVLRDATSEITAHQYRLRITDFGVEGEKIILDQYHKVKLSDDGAMFGWPYLDKQGLVMDGEVVSYVGRPMAGKSFLTAYSAIHNWRRKHDVDKKRKNVLFVSMEMMTLPVSQRIAAMYTGYGISELKTGFPTPIYEKFAKKLKTVSEEDNHLYIVDGNLAASVEDIYLLADSLKCGVVYIDGAYLVRHRNSKLDRFARAAENVELMKRYTSDLGMATFASWQFNRAGAKKKGSTSESEASLEDIGYSDAIGQISSVVLGLFQEDTVETLGKRKIRLLKGRNGETGEFTINWDFIKMDFSQLDPPLEASQEVEEEYKELLV
jgi:replicative DNA helicase